MSRSRSRVAVMSVVLAAVAVLSGCGSSDDSSSTSSGSSAPSASTAGAASGADKAVVAVVPAAVKSKGTLTVAADASYPPNEFIGSDGKTVEGMDADLAKALGGAHGREGQGRQRDLRRDHPRAWRPRSTTSACRRSPTRRSASRPSTSSTYFSAGTSFYVKAQGGPTINSLADLCGHKVAAEKGTTQATDATAQGKKCKAAGQGRGDAVGLPRPERREPRALERPRRRRHGRLARRGVPGQEVQRPVQAHGQVLRDGALRHRDPEGLGARQARARGA